MLKKEMLEAAIKNLENAHKEYAQTIKAVFWEVIRNSLYEIAIDLENKSYYLEIIPDDEADFATDSDFASSEIQARVLERVLDGMTEKLYTVFENEGNDIYVDWTLCTDNDIHIIMEIDGISIEVYFYNRYNKK